MWHVARILELRNAYKILENLNGRNHSKDVRVDDRIKF
jgi:hypothetical protein